MVGFTPSKKYPSDFNGGVKYKSGDAVQAKTVNDLVESALWVQELAFGDATIVGETPYEVEVSSNSNDWQQVNGKWQFRIPQTAHNFQRINSVVAERKMNTDRYENMIYSYKRYLTGAIAIIVDKRIDMKVVIKGEK